MTAESKHCWTSVKAPISQNAARGVIQDSSAHLITHDWQKGASVLPQNFLLSPALHSSSSFLMWPIPKALQNTSFFSWICCCWIAILRDQAAATVREGKAAEGRLPPSAVTSCSISLASSDKSVEITQQKEPQVSSTWSCARCTILRSELPQEPTAAMTPANTI